MTDITAINTSDKQDGRNTAMEMEMSCYFLF